MALYYEEPLYRPPSEAGSLLIQATVGCAFAHCTYCISSVTGRFAIRPLKDIEQDLEEARRLYGPQVPRIFLLAQNALVMPASDLIKLSELAYELFPGLQRISLYAHPLDLLNKTPEELKAIHDAGLTLLYVGLESGNDEVLRRIKKHSTAEKSIRACRRAIEAGLKLSCTVIIGLGGQELTREHAQDTGKMITAISPHYLGCLTLMPYPGSELDRSIAQGTFAPLSTFEVMEEFRILLENIGPLERPCVFRANHASNYLSLAGDLPADRDRLIREVKAAQSRPESLRPEAYRAL
ncbi:MAG: radical SAM protein [Deltaproteobacteria bacterium]|nr:radical SAM protein [Deltaproteobacteria bacterium]